MPPYLETVKSFADVPTDKGVETKEFLEAADGVVGLFAVLGSSAFALVQSDLKGNIEKVRNRYNADPEKSATLELLVKNEMKEKKRVATEGLMWLIRGLSFTCCALRNAQDKKVEMSAAFRSSYDVTLRQYHNFVVRGIFSVAVAACPHRKDFFTKLATDPEGGASTTEEKVDADLDRWLVALDKIVKMIEAFYEAGGHGKGF